ncbi:MAG: hypothetical protein J0L77_05120 [Alphaproteobacteria bacterium]|nr:hypothetical protein [Alphaproteobacteria bacterium]
MVFVPNPYSLNISPGKVAIQGQIGSFSHATLRAVFGKVADANVRFFDNFYDPFQALSNNDVRTAVIPIRNTIAGFVPEVPPLIQKHGLQIVGEYFMPIEMCLLGIPGSRLSDIRFVTSHPMALKQCTEYLSRECTSVARIIGEDTGGAAKKVARDKRKEYAAIAGPGAAEAYGLETLAHGIENIKNNVTRFVILQRDYAQANIKEEDRNFERENGRQYVTTILFKPKRSVSHALTHILMEFMKENIDHTAPLELSGSANMGPTGFLIDLTGHANDSKIVRALERIRLKKSGDGLASSMKIIGSYPAHHTNRFSRNYRYDFIEEESPALTLGVG